MQRVKEEVFRAIGAIYIKPFISKLPLAFCENSENYGKIIDVEQKILKALRLATIMREGLEESLRDLRKQTAPPPPAFVIISDFEEEHVENKNTKKEEQAKRLVKVEQPNFFH